MESRRSTPSPRRFPAAALAAAAFAVGGASADHASGATASSTPPTFAIVREEIVLFQDGPAERLVRNVSVEGATGPFFLLFPTPSIANTRIRSAPPAEALRREFPFRAPQGFGGNEGHRKKKSLPLPKRLSLAPTKFPSGKLARHFEPGSLPELRMTLEKEGVLWNVALERSLARLASRHLTMLRFDPDPKEFEVPILRTVPLSFEFTSKYPYLDASPLLVPLGAQPQAPSQERLRELWLVTNEPHDPVNVETVGSEHQWVKPFEEGSERSRHCGGLAGDRLEAALGPLASWIPRPGAPLEDCPLQAFQDQKPNQENFGEILFLPRRPLEEGPDPLVSSVLALDAKETP